MSNANAEPSDAATEHYRNLVRQNDNFCRALTVALNCGTETAAGMTATVRTRGQKAFGTASHKNR
jgi:hypothetical protein